YVCLEIGNPKTRSTRLAPIMRTLVPRRRRRTRANSVLAWICVRANNRALSWMQATAPRGGQRSNWYRTDDLIRRERAGGGPFNEWFTDKPPGSLPRSREWPILDTPYTTPCCR